jgi:chemotaxis protein methyltransferase CheR
MKTPPLIDTLQRLYGAEIAPYDESFLIKSFEKKLAGVSFRTGEAYDDFIRAHSPEAEDFLRSLQISYSEFFRNSLIFAFLEQRILPLLMEENSGRNGLRIWSAACAAGQEAYSIAMLLDEVSESKTHCPAVRIFASDVSKSALAIARSGVYDLEAVQNVKLKYIRKYFMARGETFVIIDRMKDRIDFSRFDLLDTDSFSPVESIYGGFDIVFCSNVLYYFKAEYQQQILDKMYRSLSHNGYLVTSESERAIVEKTRKFRMVAPPMAIYQKTGWKER